MTNRRLACLSICAILTMTAVPATPALANGAASTRNIILGGAAAAAATLLIINHNKKVHQKYAEYDRRQAETQASANNAEAAYASERSAYAHEASLVSSYRHEVAVQHQEVVRLRHQIAMRGGRSQNVAARIPAARSPQAARPNRAGTQVATTSYGWGAL